MGRRELLLLGLLALGCPSTGGLPPPDDPISAMKDPPTLGSGRTIYGREQIEARLRVALDEVARECAEAAPSTKPTVSSGRATDLSEVIAQAASRAEGLEPGERQMAEIEMRFRHFVADALNASECTLSEPGIARARTSLCPLYPIC